MGRVASTGLDGDLWLSDSVVLCRKSLKAAAAAAAAAVVVEEEEEDGGDE
jgi:hypothetical protein